MKSLVSFIAVGVAVAVAGVAHADDVIPPVVGGKTWVQHQIVVAKARHKEIVAITVEGARPGSADIITFGSTVSAARVFHAVDHPVTTPGAARVAGRYVVRRVFESAGKNRLGMITITFAKGGARADAIASEVVAGLSRHTLSAKNAVDPWPYDASFDTPRYAQMLTERITHKYPDLIVMMIHATPPGGPTNVVIGSNIGRIGKAADDDDLRVIEKGSTNLEVADTKDRFETELPLNDARGTRIGALGLVFPFHEGADRDAIHARGRAIRDDLAAMIPNNAELFTSAK